MKRFIGAWQFLTVLPIRGETVSPGQAAVWFPLVGAAIGLAAVPLWRLHPLLAVLGWVLLTGALHEDGFADCADAFRAGRSRDRILAILKDSRIGTFGAIAVVFSIAGRWQALEHLTLEPWRAFAASHAASRGAMVLLAFVTPPAGTGLGRAFSGELNWPVFALVAMQTMGACLLVHPYAAVATVALIWLSHWYFLARLGGVTGDCLGATCQLIETAVLWVAAK